MKYTPAGGVRGANVVEAFEAVIENAERKARMRHLITNIDEALILIGQTLPEEEMQNVDHFDVIIFSDTKQAFVVPYLKKVR